MGPERASVVVVGAGAAGLSFARVLAERGESVVVLERLDQVGGKCFSLHHRGHSYDLGANFTTPRYTRTRALADAVGVRREPLGPRRTLSVVDERAPQANAVTGLLLELASRWYALRRSWTSVDQDGFANLEPALHQSFASWLRAGGLGPIRSTFDALFTSYGYGPVAELPAAYALKFFDPVHLGAAVKLVRAKAVTTTADFVGGFASVWAGVVEKWAIDVRTGAEVESVKRSNDGVAIQYVQGGETRRLIADRVVLACPLDGALEFLDASAEERRLFTKIRHFDYRVIAAKARGLGDISTYLYPWSRVYTPGQPVAFYNPKVGDPEDVFLFYAYGDADHDDQAILDNLRAVLAHPSLAAELTEVLTVQRWTYFPHVDVHTIGAGFYEDIEALQGQNRTWYVGELLAFPLVELVIRYSEALAARDFPPAAHPVGSGAMSAP